MPSDSSRISKEAAMKKANMNGPFPARSTPTKNRLNVQSLRLLLRLNQKRKPEAKAASMPFIPGYMKIIVMMKFGKPPLIPNTAPNC